MFAAVLEELVECEKNNPWWWHSDVTGVTCLGSQTRKFALHFENKAGSSWINFKNMLNWTGHNPWLPQVHHKTHESAKNIDLWTALLKGWIQANIGASCLYSPVVWAFTFLVHSHFPGSHTAWEHFVLKKQTLTSDTTTSIGQAAVREVNSYNT